MGTTYPEVLDISSDEEEDGLGDRSDWLASLLDPVEKEDSDEVIVVREVAGNSLFQEQTSKPSVKDCMDDMDDDDCLILEDDPDKPVECSNDTGNESDELQVVSEKGQIACRDYPHPRHLCARFPFNTNPHEKYCDLCHCYVCETRAPCTYWGTGVSSSDHCHSTDKEEVWRVQRKWSKSGKIAPLPAPKHPKKLSPFVDKSPPAFVVPPPLNYGNAVPHTLPKSNKLGSCTATSNFDVPNIISQRNHQALGDSLGRTRLPHHGISRSASLPPGSGVINGFNRRDKGGGGNSLGPRFLSPHVKFKRGGSGGATLSMSRSGNSSREYSNYLLQPQQTGHLGATYNETSRSQQLKACQNVFQQQQMSSYTAVSYSDTQSPRSQEANACQNASQPNTGADFLGSISYDTSLLPQVYSQPIPLLNENQKTYLPENPSPNLSDQNLSDFQLNWLNETVPSFATSAENTQLGSVKPTSESPVPELIFQKDVNLASTEFDLENWIQSLVHRPDLGIGNDSVSSSHGFVPTKAEQPESAGLSFEFRNS